MNDKKNTQTESAWSGQHIVFLLLIVIAGFFLWNGHKAHILGVLPFLILLLCPLMHFFMHRGHGGHNDHNGKHGNHNDND